ncbi:PTS sugar transporter [Ruania alba]|uniref:Phosphotransferase system IIC components, glucose/maltose/N-acetylglucosamine-specific n=1 Tax=Ruania alba TaxID=648782 RepID=A0A1H5EN59_9MICO|nr:PTS sugar transporter [Ruania alba]SED92607.1 Phosphotransferase system IIC components, glucose/maltose/N-acetylglucosamine-specific [Ruania alba]
MADDHGDVQSGTTTHSVAVLGSSGGNLRSHGGNDPAKLIRDVQQQLAAAGFTLGEVQFVSASSSMDGVSQSTPAELWGIDDGTPIVLETGTLGEINEIARSYDERLAAKVTSGEIDGLILMSADPTDTNAQTIAAAAKAGIPAAGTGGSSIAKAQQLGVNLVSASGTTGTTSSTRAVSYVSGLARHWKVKYRPVLGSSSAGSTNAATEEAAWRRISIRGIMVGSIPAFIALALVLAVSKIPWLDGLTPVFDALIAGLPIVVAAVAARKVSGLDEVGLVAGAIAGILSQQGGILGGLVGGVLAGLVVSWLIKWTLAHRFPATTANIVTGALAGLLPGLVVYFLLAPFTSLLGEWVKYGIEWTVDFSPLLAGALAGLAMWPAIIGGVYHSVILPLVLLEMGQKGHSFFGAIDMVALVMVSLGITLANVVKPRTSGERALAGSGAGVNFFFGTFVESSYPFMFGDKKVFGIALVSATMGGTLVGLFGVEATAYLPAMVAPFIATNALGMVVAMVATAALSFTLTLLANLAAIRKARQVPSAV